MTRPRPADLNTDDDLLQDQRSFFQQNNLPDPSSDPLPPTPTSELLPPIKERVVRPRTRRNRAKRTQQQSQPFPPIPNVTSSSQSVFARRTSLIPTTDSNAASSTTSSTNIPLNSPNSATNSNPPSTSSNYPPAPAISSDARAAFEAMSLDEIQEAQRDLMQSLKPSSLQFLKEKWQQRRMGTHSNAVHNPTTPVPILPVQNASQSDESIENSSSKPLQPSSRTTETFQSAQLGSTDTGNTTSQVADQSHHPVHHDLTQPSTTSENHMSSQTLRNTSSLNRNTIASSYVTVTERTQAEDEKKQWMMDASIKIPTDEDLDRTLATAIEAIGPIAKTRFDLTGHILTEEQIRSLPTHMALHHHGSSPADAGYTLPDILTLLRSSVVTQRIIALNLLKALVSRHRDSVLPCLTNSDALSLAFNPFPSPSAFHATLTNQLAYIDVVEALTADFPVLDETQLTADRYFASRFYSIPPRPVLVPKLFEILSKSDCVPTLLRIAVSTISRPDTVPVAIRSLILIRTLVVQSPHAALAVLYEASAIPMLLHMTSFSALSAPSDKSKDHPSSSVLIACDILAHVIAHLSASESSIRLKLQQSVLTDMVVERVCTKHLATLVGISPSSASHHLFYPALGALRLLRACLPSAVGIISLSSCVAAVCFMTRRGGDIAVEAFLALEAFVHSMHQKILGANDHENMETKTEKDTLEGVNLQASRVASTVVNEAFVKDQLSSLVPEALSACRLFASSKRGILPAQRAAAGHFAASVLAVYRVPLDAGFFAAVLSACSDAGGKLKSTIVSTYDELEMFRDFASVSHAGARLLHRLKLEPAYAKREIDVVFGAAVKEKDFLTDDDARGEWRPVANSCAEWLGLLPRVDHGLKPAKLAIGLLDCLSDPQVVVDVLSRCILRREILQTMDSSISEKSASKCSEDLLPIAFDELSGKEKVVSAEREESRDGDEGLSEIGDGPPPSTLKNILKIWVQVKAVFPSFLIVVRALLTASLIDPAELFQLLLLANADLFGQFEDEVSLLLYQAACACASLGCNLIVSKEDFKVSHLSTTPNPASVDSVLTLADILIARGPTELSLQTPHGSSCDALATVLLTLMFHGDVDVDLRVSLWKKLIDDCGGGMLFCNAVPLKSSGPSMEKGKYDQDDELLRAVSATLARGILTSQRCPPCIALIVIPKLAARTERDECLNVMGAYLQSMTDENFAASFESLAMIQPEDVQYQRGFNQLFSWVRGQI